MKKSIAYIFIIILWIFCHGLLITAQGSKEKKSPENEPVYQEPITTVVATRTPEPVFISPFSVSVVSGQALQQAHSLDLSDGLRDIPGVDVARSGYLGSVTSFFIRGGNSSHTLVLIDGVRANDPTTGAFDFGSLLPTDIERVEVLRGPQSTLYGSEAMGGVVNIMTKQGQGKPTVQLESEYGSMRTLQQIITLSGSGSVLNYLFSYDMLNVPEGRQGSRLRGHREFDPYFNRSALLKLGSALTSHSSLELTLRNIASQAHVDDFPSFAVGTVEDSDEIQKGSNTLSSLQYKSQITNFWDQVTTLSLTDGFLKGEDSIEDMGDPFSNFLIKTRTWRVEQVSHFHMSDSEQVTAGMEYRGDEGKNIGSFSRSISNRGYFIQNDLTLWRHLHTVMGGRLDNSTFGTHFTYRAGTAWEIPRWETVVHTSYGTGFRAPSLNDLFFGEDTPFPSGNLNLKPEKNWGYDAGVRQRLVNDTMEVDLTRFFNSYRDLITFDPVTFIPVNLGRARSEGFEFEWTQKPWSWLSNTLSFTQDEARDLVNDRPLARRPKFRYADRLTVKPCTKVDVVITNLMVKKRIDADGSNMDNYWRTDVTVNYRISQNMTAFVRVENLFNQKYEEIRFFDTPGFSVFSGVDLTF